MRAAGLVLAILGALAGCGPTVVHRPLELFVGGLSGRAETLVVLIFPGPGAPACPSIQLDTVQSREAPHRAEWQRAGSEKRGLALPDVDADQLTLVAYSEDAAGAAIQLACVELEYADLESPEVSLQLSTRRP